AASPIPRIDGCGRDVLLVVVKTSFVVDPAGAVRRAERQVPVLCDDVPRDPSDPRSSIRYPSDTALQKVGFDVVVVGDALSPRPVPQVDVGVKVGDRLTVVRVHGQRFYYRGALGVSIGPAVPFERMPVVYERAYGGTGPDGVVLEPRNPLG